MKHLFLAIAIGLIAMGCGDREEQEQAYCGCDSPTINSEQNGKELSGYLYLHNGKYKIFTSNGNLQLAYSNTICNVNAIPKSLKDQLKKGSVDVIYKANFKEDCEHRGNMSMTSYYNIELINIKKID